MLKMKDIVAFRRTRDGRDILLDYHGYSLSDFSQQALDDLERLGEWVSPDTYLGDAIVFKKNFIFKESLMFDCFVRGRSSAQARYISQNTRDSYSMFLTDISDLIHKIGDVSHLEGEFTYTKKGSNYAIKFLGKVAGK